LNFNPNLKVYLAPGVTDLRKSINGLSLLVENQLLNEDCSSKNNLFSGTLFGFCNRNRSLIKILYWDRNGFALWMKRLETDRFKWPTGGSKKLSMTQRELSWLLEGLEPEQKLAHQSLEYCFVS